MIYIMIRNIHKNTISFIVTDMAGTIINEGGIIYDTLYDTLKSLDIGVTENDKKRWGGKDKAEVLKSEIIKLASKDRDQDYLFDKSTRVFKELITSRYFESNNIKLINEKLPDMFELWRMNGVKIALNTGYPHDIQERIIQSFHMNEYIDDYISSDKVSYGRPYPYMVHTLMERNSIINSKNVMKVGDTTNDIIEGINANCGMVCGVLSGYENKIKLENAGSDIISDSIMDLKDIILHYEDFFL